MFRVLSPWLEISFLAQCFEPEINIHVKKVFEAKPDQFTNLHSIRAYVLPSFQFFVCCN